MINVSIVEDDKFIRESLKDLLNDSEGFKCLGAYSDCESAIKDLLWNKPAVMLMDIELPGMSGIEGVKKIKEKKECINKKLLLMKKEILEKTNS